MGYWDDVKKLAKGGNVFAKRQLYFKAKREKKK